MRCVCVDYCFAACMPGKCNVDLTLLDCEHTRQNHLPHAGEALPYAPVT